MVAADGVVVTRGYTPYNYKNLKREFSKQDLEKLLLEDGYTYKELQGLYIYNERLWSRLAKEYDIPKQYKNITRNLNKHRVRNIDNNLLIDLYVNKKLSLREVGRRLGCNYNVIKNRLLELNVEIRPFNDPNYYKNRNHKKGHWSLESSNYWRLSNKRLHRMVMEKQLGRELLSNEYVHHIDLDKTNNNIDNLFLFNSNQEHISYHGFIKSHEYVHPDEFLTNIYPKIIYYQSKEFLYDQYVVQNKSIAQISRDIDNYLSRRLISKKLKEYKLFVEGKHINQYSEIS